MDQKNKISYKEGYDYQLVEDAVFRTKIIGYSIDTKFIKLTLIGILTVKAGYAWNGANIIPDSNMVMRGSCGHDAGCQLIQEGLLPKSEKPYVDLLLYDCCIEDGMEEIFAQIILEGVQTFGDFSVDPKNINPVLTAP